MLKRCYSIHNGKSYKDCSVCDEWLTFSNFRAWMEQQDWKDKELDKDLLVEGNLIYSPEACMFVPRELNIFTVTQRRNIGKLPMGVFLYKGRKKNPYYANISTKTRGTDYIGAYPNPLLAHMAYLKVKLEQCKMYQEKYKNYPKIFLALERISGKILHHIENKLILTTF